MKNLLYEAFLDKYAKPIHKTLEALAERESVVELDPLIAEILANLGVATTVILKGDVGYKKNEKFDKFYSDLKETQFYEDIQKRLDSK